MTGLFFISKLPQRLQDAVAFWGQWFKQDLYSLGLKCLDTSDFPPSVIDRIHATIRRARFAANSMVRLCRLEKEPAGTTCVPMDICLSTKGKVRCGH